MVACARGGGARAASVRARPRHGSVAAGPSGPRGAPPRRAARARAQVRPAQDRTPDRGGHRQAAGAYSGGQGLRGGVLV